MRKDKFTLEDDVLYVLLKDRVWNRRLEIVEASASKLYVLLAEDAEALGRRDFHRRYKSPMSIGQRIANIRMELRVKFKLEIWVARGNVKVYTFRTLGVDAEIADLKARIASARAEGEEAVKKAKAKCAEIEALKTRVAEVEAEAEEAEKEEKRQEEYEKEAKIRSAKVAETMALIAEAEEKRVKMNLG